MASEEEGLVNNGGEMPQWVKEVLSFGGKHRVGDKMNFNSLLILIFFLSELKSHRVPGENLFAIEAMIYTERVKQTPSDKRIEETRKFLKHVGLLDLPLDKGVGFCAMWKNFYEAKLHKVSQSVQFSGQKHLPKCDFMKVKKISKKNCYP